MDLLRVHQLQFQFHRNASHSRIGLNFPCHWRPNMPRENGSNEKKPKPKNRIESNVNYEMDKQDDTQ